MRNLCSITQADDTKDPTYKLLQQIRSRPGVYFGCKSLERLHLFISGYNFHKAEKMTELRERSEEFTDPDCFNGFQQYVELKYDSKTSHGWWDLISLNASNDEGAFDLFYEVFDEFIELKKDPVFLNKLDIEYRMREQSFFTSKEKR